MRPDLTESQMAGYNRQLFVPGSHDLTPGELHDAYGLVFGHQPDQTTVFRRIPQHEPSSPRVDTAPRPSTSEPS
jgi:hypothetical protein